MNELPKDIQEKILNQLSIVDFYNFIVTKEQEKEKEKQFNDFFWRRRIQRDFPSLLSYIDNIKIIADQNGKEIPSTDLKKYIYIKIAKEYITRVKEFEDIIYHSFGKKFLQFLTEEYKKKLNLTICGFFNGSLKYLLENCEEYTEAWISDITSDYIWEYRRNFVKLLPDLMVDKYDNDLYWNESINEPLQEYITYIFNYFEIFEEE